MTSFSSSASVSVSRAGAVATITVGNGEHLNAMGRAEWRSLGALVTELAADESLSAVVVRGRGGRFSAGSNLNDWNGASASDVDASFAEIEAALQSVENLPMPTVAVVEGVAAGGGCQLLLACDLQLVAHSARLGMPTAQLGILVPPSFSNRLTLRIGPSRAKALLFGGELLSAQEANAIGLVTRVIVDEELDAELARLLERWAAQSSRALRAAKRAVNLGLAPVEQPARDRVLEEVSDPGEFADRVNGFLHRKKPSQQ
ncbi:enoyl-CoA hydratase/isomerase family protein [Microbacterium sp.]|uniref:enoyl-CoA hydratase/isomerase family protein n=1 Tax=Microbacterium sp. TaxID=51671 RepID=UPI003A933F98